MEYRSSSVSLPTILFVLTLAGSAASAGAQPALQPAFQAESQQDQKQPPKSDSKEKGTALTGCIDEQEGRYVLIDDRNLSPIADLVAEGFPTESFAKHVGHKVTVRGTSSSGGTRPIFKVRSIETVSESCKPNQ